MTTNRKEENNQSKKSYIDALDLAASQALEVDSNQNVDPNREQQLDASLEAFLDDLQAEWKKEFDN